MHQLPSGRPKVFSDQRETELVDHLIVCSEWGQPLSPSEVRMLAKRTLEMEGIKEPRFAANNNMPGEDWCAKFLARHNERLKVCLTSNLKSSRAEVTTEAIKNYFKNLEKTVQGIAPHCMISLILMKLTLWMTQERKNLCIKRKIKYPENISNYTQGSTSVMFAAAANGNLLPPYTVYKADNLCDRWTINGPSKARYGTSKSGWFDSTNFDEWFKTIILPYCKKQKQKCVIIGNNLSSHMSLEVTLLCQDHNIEFCFLPPNSTNLTKPLDVAVFRPIKVKWRALLHSYKANNRTKLLTKDEFSGMLKLLLEHNGIQKNANVVKGFETCGILPFNPEAVLKLLT